ncbi:Sphingosine N-acyltransferase lag1 [Ceratocystis lukuohia]|uniref:Sphingosine N-acyltransferase lag1 n=3 Tax=Ceratocystis TaxID=5157 RepID=A0A0F8DHT9_CERFI|nr:Sphingosine N-acyltransferase lag1 [Ceratocystis platani]PHH54326.1 Sphingosine N-acyltransferase lag1 [Ceratocystis fimbriata CBS 114723]
MAAQVPAIELTSEWAPNDVTNHHGPLYASRKRRAGIISRKPLKYPDSLMAQLSRAFVENQISYSFNLLALLFLADACLPKSRPYTRKFFTLSYYNGSTEKYAAGADDIYFISFCVVLFTFLRASVMQYLLTPIARMGGITRVKMQARFTEQAWLLVYYGFFWTFGMYIYYTSPYWMNMKELWTNWPDRELNGLSKLYILAQWGFWVQQVLVINIEERRKDHYQMLTHHFITIALVSSCYSYHQTRVGILILVLMDVVDLFLPLAKCLKYTGFSTLCDVMFGIFMVSWVVARHFLYMAVCWSIYADIPVLIGNSCYTGNSKSLSGPFPTPEGYSYLIQPFIKADGLVCFNDTVRWLFLAPLLMLQVITLVWFTMILRVAARVIRGAGATDSRSDEEDSDQLEKEVDASSINFGNWEKKNAKRQAAASTTTGVSLAAHSGGKELLGRIGCEKHVE